MSSDFSIGGAVEVFANEAPRSSLLRRSSHFDYEGLIAAGYLAKFFEATTLLRQGYGGFSPKENNAGWAKTQCKRR